MVVNKGSASFTEAFHSWGTASPEAPGPPSGAAGDGLQPSVLSTQRRANAAALAPQDAGTLPLLLLEDVPWKPGPASLTHRGGGRRAGSRSCVVLTCLL